MHTAMDTIRQFRDGERWHYTDADQNLFALSVSQADRYYQFLGILRSRIEATATALAELHQRMYCSAEPGIHQLSEEEGQLLDASSSLQTQIQMDVETFFVFAKILLDKLAHFLEHYFGPESGTSFRSHDKLVKFFSKFVAAKELQPCRACWSSQHT